MPNHHVPISRDDDHVDDFCLKSIQLVHNLHALDLR